MLLSGAPPAGSRPGPRAQGSAGGGPGGSRRGAGGAGAGPGGGGSGGVAKWLREHLGFRGGGGGGGGSKPAPPEPDYRPPAPSPAAPPAPPPDILAAYRLQRERDFEDPYSGGSSGSAALATPAAPGPTPPPRHGSPPHRLIRVETPGPPAPPADERISGPPASSDRLAILEDYADPFDVQETGEGSAGASGAPEKVPENDGYMEPYEAQKMMAEIRGSKETATQPLPLYDTPYEPEEDGATPEGEGAPWPRESRLPEDDERPPEEYDQPWEWKKERISKAFAAQFEGSEKSCLSPGREEKGRLPPRLSAGNPKSAKPLSVEPSSPLGEWTDPALPLENQVWYHGAISRTDAENLLRLCKEASYLVRNSETSKNDFSLSLKSSQGFMHMKLSRTKEHKYVLGQNSPPFSSVPEIVHHYASRKLPIKGAEHMSLLYPVAIRTL
ncbi:SH2 domain-containing adapter protein F isoform X2 [Macaca nemestrina]|uniref:Src homology 2 domain containing F n=8 Tax=Cercopithecidae TaxID=9527 RepID=A0A2K6DJS8_MACNE|nr:SH2 domain-containing adapter protein F isoform X2 [Papio anubis]XP_011755481.1 SH2 domain-containing adapter protein F isoform X2 [Macaca nemestrina]XP_023082970.1 SH2 domain-containing adapter protein F isoform X1 [Piliocolobus tephrosceles]XP_030786894.1 SH2 domain-containing adapter protein F isoform X3 [Rhinopithecus roxellana]XP_045251318.1 SH2 domain-containing adapter protein F isoform X2 [Macaca fascicularis]